MEDGFLIGWDGMVQRKQDAMTSAILRSIMQEQLNEELLLEVRKPPSNISDNSFNNLAQRIVEDVRVAGSVNDPVRKVLQNAGITKAEQIKAIDVSPNPKIRTRKVKKVKAKKIRITPVSKKKIISKASRQSQGTNRRQKKSDSEILFTI